MGHQTITKTIGLLKAKKWAVAGVSAALITSYAVGSSSAQADIDGKKLNYDQVVKKIEAINAELKKKQDELKAQDKRLEARKAEVDHALDLADRKDELTKDIDAKTTELDNKKNELSQVEASIKEKQAELDKLTNTVAAKQEEPRQLSAGDYTVGTDIPASRYKAVPVGRGSNFIVYDVAGGLKVNTILGDNFGLGEKEYVFYAEDGDRIHTEARVKLIPVE